MDIAVVTDTTACLPTSWVDAASDVLRVVPLTVTIDGESFIEGVSVSAQDVAQAQADGLSVITGRPSPGLFVEAFEAAQEAGAKAIVAVHLPQKLSSTAQSAHLAAAQVDLPVHVLDVGAIGMGLGFAARAGGEVARAGGEVDAVIARIQQVARNSSTAVYVDSLEALRKGGRLGRAGAFFGTALSIKPLLTLKDGALAPLERVRTTPKAIERLTKRTLEAAQAVVEGTGKLQVAVHSMARRDLAEPLLEQLQDAFGPEAVVEAELSASVIAHVGAGTVATVVADLAEFATD